MSPTLGPFASARRVASAVSSRLSSRLYSSPADVAAGPSHAVSTPAAASASSSAGAAVVDAAAAESLESAPFSYPHHLPHQGAFLPRPSVIPGKKTRAVRDSEVPEVGTFTRDNAWVSTSPTKVRERLARTLDKQLPGEELPILHPTELRAWWAARIAGRLPTNPMGVEEVRESQLAWAKKRHGKRERVRGIKDEQVVGQRIYLPNIVFRLMYNQTAFIRGSSQSRAPVAMEQYNPYIATFRIPKALTKPDIKSYLKAVYNLDTTFVRTDVRNAPNRRIQQGDRRGQWTQKDSSKSYKRAVVGLTRPFHYPGDKHNVEPAEKERLAREKRDREEAEREQRIYEKKMQDRRIDFSGTVRISSEGKPASVYGPNVQPGDRVQKRVLARAQAQRDEYEEDIRREALGLGAVERPSTEAESKEAKDA